MKDARILLIDDEREIHEMIAIVLRKEGFEQIRAAETGEEALQICKEFLPHLIVLDVMLPDTDGFLLCQKLREITDVPILFLTAKNTDLDKLLGFRIGGDDYITKPFNPLELAARIEAQLRRMQKFQAYHRVKETVYDFGEWRINETSGQLIVRGQEVSCPAMEFKLLAFLAAHPDRIFSKQQLYEQVWGEESLGDENTVMVHIRRIREKIEENPGKPKYLVTVRGLGYKLVSPQKERA